MNKNMNTIKNKCEQENKNNFINNISKIHIMILKELENKKHIKKVQIIIMMYLNLN